MTGTALVEPDALASYLQRDLDRASAEQALDLASDTIRDYCRWNLSRETVTWTLDGTGTSILTLPTLHLVDVTFVTIDGELIERGTGADTATYTWSAGGILCRTAGWPRRNRCIEVDAVHGHDPIPGAIRAAVLTLAARMMTDPEGLLSKTVGAVSRTFEPRDVLTTLELARVDRHRL